MKHIIVDFDTEGYLGRDFDAVRPIGVLLERGEQAGFDSLYLESVTEEQDSGHDNYVRTMEATQTIRDIWDAGLEEPTVTVEQLFTRLADAGYLGLRLRSLGKVDDGVTLQEVFDQYVVQAEPLTVFDDEEFDSGI